ncbi:uncharacterized protein CMU_025390 [Cryptosporidium muris RN66]|uniref:Uncharacterized protein n=1 Tax=Cryptosporidium muris (strain RN66) TaxID=441375 RepID=B6AAY1_CRYMR|nr:uncharacterized protein CMU_025390 [Cryptosporidium muris RN66]EEA05533.1 hypothetical protein, conserved [Cryptosporidium muris RN66]|eukprot:XP_002139882.1 hypothetical protein [Cryptosporidium muris RN66]
MNNEKLEEDYEDDILEEYDVVLSHINDVSFHVFQFPLTPANRSPSNGWESAYLRLDGSAFQLSYYAKNQKKLHGDDKLLGKEQDQSGIFNEFNNDNTENKYLYTLNSRSCLSTASSLIAGYINHEKKKLYITPVSSIQQFRPNFSHIDLRKSNSSITVGNVERNAGNIDDNEQRDLSLDNLIMNRVGNPSLSNTSESSVINQDKFLTNGVENWIKIPCLFESGSYESKELVKLLCEENFDDFIIWPNSINIYELIDSKSTSKSISLYHTDNRTILQQLVHSIQLRNNKLLFDSSLTRYLDILCGIIRSPTGTVRHIPFGGSGQVLPSLRTGGLPKIYTSYQYPPICPTSSLGGCIGYNFGGTEENFTNCKVNLDEFPNHGIPGQLLVFDDWFHQGPLSFRELYKMTLEDQIKRITLVYQVISFSGIKYILNRIYTIINGIPKYNTNLNFETSSIDININELLNKNYKFNNFGNIPEGKINDKIIIDHLKKYCVLVSGNWIYRSDLLYNEYEACCRDLILVLLQRDENTGLNREPIRVATDLPQIKVTSMLQELAIYKSTAWYPKFSLDRSFIEEFPQEYKYWKNYWDDREKYVVQYIRQNRANVNITLTALNDSSTSPTSISNSQLQLLVGYILRTYGARSIIDIHNLCIYHLQVMSLGNPSLILNYNNLNNNNNLDSGTNNSAKSSIQIEQSQKFSNNRGFPNNNTSILSSTSCQNFFAPSYAPPNISHAQYPMRQVSELGITNNQFGNFKIHQQDLNKALESVATCIYYDIWVISSIGDPRIDGIRRIIIGYLKLNNRDDVFTITSFIDNIKHHIIQKCIESYHCNEWWCTSKDNLVDKEQNIIINTQSQHAVSLINLLNNIPDLIWRRILHEFAFPINTTSTVWSLKGRQQNQVDNNLNIPNIGTV